jgi:hypothetical protein
VRSVLPAVLLVLAILAPTLSFADKKEEQVVGDKPLLLLMNPPEEETVLHVKSFLMEVQIDGKQVGQNIVVDISIEKTDGGYIATWDAVHIYSIELANNVKRTRLRAKHYGTDTGSIRNIVVKEKVITFDIIRSHGDMKVDIFRTGEYHFGVEIKAYGIHDSKKKQRKFTEEWVMTTGIKLPSEEIFGFPEKKVKKRH